MNKILFVVCLVFSISKAVQELSLVQKQRLLQDISDQNNICSYVVLDGGSSKTQINFYTYQCRKHLSIPQNIQQVKILKGQKDKFDSLSSLKNATIQQKQDYFDNIFRNISAIKEKQQLTDRNPTFLFLRATAGLRLLQKKLQEEFLRDVRQIFRDQTQFYFLDDSWADIISGESEGLYLWVAVNYALENIQNNAAINLKQTTSVIEIGGASAQIAFATNLQNTYKFLDLPGKNKIQVYSKSFLGYGNNEVMESIFENADYPSCFQKSETEYKKFSERKNIELNFKGNYNYTKCVNIILKFMKFNNEYTEFSEDLTFSARSPIIQSNQMLDDLTKQANIIGVGAIYYAKNQLFGGETNISLKQFRKKANQYCSNDLVIDVNKSKKNQEFQQIYCFQMMWVSTFLIDGLGLLDKNITITDNIKGFSVNWSLGSLINDISTMQCNNINTNECDQYPAITKEPTKPNESSSSSLISNSTIILYIIYLISLKL